MMKQFSGMPGVSRRLQQEEEAGSLRRPDRERASNVAVKLRLMRMGKKKQPTYRVVAADSRSPRDGRFIEILGTYEPRAEPSVILIDNGQGGGVAVEGRPADRAGRQAAGDVRGHGRVPGRPGGRVGATVSTELGEDGANEAVDDYNRVNGGMAKGVLDYLARNIVDDPEAVVVDLDEGRRGDVRLSLHVAPEDMGKVIGRRGRVGPGHPRRGARRPGPARASRSPSTSSTEPDPPPVPLLEVGRIVKPHGLRGDVVVELVTNRDERVAAGAVLWAGGRELEVLRARPFSATGAGRWIVTFGGVDDLDAGRGAARRRPVGRRPSTIPTPSGSTS